MTYSFDKLLSWYFSKNSLPYWCIFLLDTIILFLSGVLSYWVFQKTGALVANHVAVLCTMLVYTFVGCFFFRLFRTYSGIVRYSSFIDLMHVANGNFCALLVALGYAVLMKSLDVRLFAALTLTQTVITFILATIVMWGMRILVKTLYDVAFSDKRAMRVLIYGALSGGIGLAKNIGSQHPRKFILRGFISHDERAKHIQLMGRRVYNVNDDLEAIIKRENVQAILVSPMRAKEFRENTALQDMLIKVGCKIYMASQAKEFDGNEANLTEAEIQHIVAGHHHTVFRDLQFFHRELNVPHRAEPGLIGLRSVVHYADPDTVRSGRAPCDERRRMPYNRCAPPVRPKEQHPCAPTTSTTSCLTS